ncbi:TraR/DksA family transcriptional regulator [Streptomyces sp. NPDC098789]|uniref:TraR/DksA family transcriptional regulator n=1 Tax=Streptomyces sp. NPDC098789 TaxID=3366098 RepID=UPI0037FF59A3
MVAKKTAAKKTASVNEASAEPVQPMDSVQPVKRAAKKVAAARSTAGTGTSGTSTAKKSTARTSTARTSAKKASAAPAAEETGAGKVVAKKSTGTARKTATAATSGLPKTRAAATATATEPGGLAVRPGEEPWTPQEAAEARTELTSEVLRLRGELAASEQAISGLMRDSGDGAGDDQADTGTKNITRESEMALAANAHDMLEQTERALERLEAGTYGLCENCGKAIGKARMQAFPRATLCVECKQKQERRH